MDIRIISVYYVYTSALLLLLLHFQYIMDIILNYCMVNRNQLILDSIQNWHMFLIVCNIKYDEKKLITETHW